MIRARVGAERRAAEADAFFARYSRPTIQDRRQAGTITTQATAVAERLLGLTPWSSDMPNAITITIDQRALDQVLALAEQTLRIQGIDDTQESRSAWNALAHVQEAMLEKVLER